MTTPTPALIVDVLRGDDGIIMPVYLKAPDEVEPYSFGWSGWLNDGETIAATTFVPDNPALGVLSSSFDPDTSNTFVWHTDGAIGDNDYNIPNHITTTEGRQLTRTYAIRMGHK